ncbi:hypothetical protein [Nocardia sp. NBC_01388]|uniref:hypothetical protein n=1 Tax=Nocardia sp. NBC_01388 TaxID=2903596 RepID=UPI003254D52C
MCRTARLITIGAVAALTTGVTTASADTASAASGSAGSGSSSMVASIVRALEYSLGASSGSSDAMRKLLAGTGSFSPCDLTASLDPACTWGAGR